MPPRTHLGRGAMVAACLAGAMLLSLVLVTVTGAVGLEDREMEIFSTVSSRREAHFRLKVPACKLLQRLFRLHSARLKAASSRLPLLFAFHTQLHRFRLHRSSISSTHDLSLHIRQELRRHDDISTAVVNLIARKLDLPKGYSGHKELGMWTSKVCGEAEKVRTATVKMVNLVYAMKYGRDKRVVGLENVSKDSALKRLLSRSPLQKGFSVPF